MNTVALRCDQAIFTSIRTPMGEGYRIVAATKGLRTEEKQTITRNSPSHESICIADGDSETSGSAMAFYSLPTGRLCVACSVLAGAEHTGRGGQRVYTQNIVFDQAGFEAVGFNPFAVARAMECAGLTEPRLNPEPILPELELIVRSEDAAPNYPSFPSCMTTAFRQSVLHLLLNKKAAIIDMPDGWMECAEALLLAIPGPARTNASLSAGLRFATGRRHALQLFSDPKGVARARVASQRIVYFEPEKEEAPVPPASGWLDFAERHWAKRNFRTLAQRTSRRFEDLSEQVRERVARLYNDVDAVALAEPAYILALAADHLDAPSQGIEGSIRAELLQSAQATLSKVLGSMRYPDLQMIWPQILTLWRKSAAGTQFAQPLIEQGLRNLAYTAPALACELATTVAQDLPKSLDGALHGAAIEEVLQRFAGWARQSRGDAAAHAADLCEVWVRLRPTCSTVKALRDTCLAAVSEQD